MRMLSILFLTLPATLIACGDEANDEPDEVAEPDADGDGLSDARELELGLDPQLADTDGDGHNDFDEVEAGTDGNVCWSVPNGWPNCSALAKDITPEGYELDQVLPSWPMTDQNGEQLGSHQFAGMVIVADISAGWCGPCNAAAPHTEEIYQQYKDQGLMVVHVMIDDWSNDGVMSDPVGFSQEWVARHGLTFPVTTDATYNGQYNEFYAQLYFSGLYEGYIPSTYVIDRDHRIVTRSISSTQIESAIAPYL